VAFFLRCALRGASPFSNWLHQNSRRAGFSVNALWMGALCSPDWPCIGDSEVPSCLRGGFDEKHRLMGGPMGSGHLPESGRQKAHPGSHGAPLMARQGFLQKIE